LDELWKNVDDDPKMLGLLGASVPLRQKLLRITTTTKYTSTPTKFVRLLKKPLYFYIERLVERSIVV